MTDKDLLVASFSNNLQTNLFALEESLGYRKLTPEEYKFIRPMLINTLDRINALIPGCEEKIPESVFKTEGDLKSFLKLD